jgi:hypothetical protein
LATGAVFVYADSMNPLIETALEAPTEAVAARILEAGGLSPSRTAETALIAFGSLDGDIIGDGAPEIPPGIPADRLRFIGMRTKPGGDPTIETATEFYYTDTGAAVADQANEQRKP